MITRDVKTEKLENEMMVKECRLDYDKRTIEEETEGIVVTKPCNY